MGTVWAVPADGLLREMVQPDGSVIMLRLVGDEHEHHYEDADGNYYDKDTDGFWYRVEARQAARRIARQRAASPYANRPRHIGAINLAPRGIVILVNYADVSYEESNDAAGMTEMLNGEHYTYEGATGSAQQYFRDQSNGKYVPQFDVVGPVTLPQNRAYYGANSGNNRDVRAAQMVVDACRKADEAGADFTLYDNDKDGTVDFVFVLYAGKGEADGGPEESIWPHNWFVRSSAHLTCMVDGLYIDNYSCAGELNGNTGKRTGIGTFCHEFGHVMGLPDYYDTRSGTNYSNRMTPRHWSIMDLGNYLNEGKTPPNYSAYDKYFFGWDTPVNLGTAEQSVTLIPVGKEGCVTYQVTASGRAAAATSTETVYYLENRQKQGWDAYLSHGLLIWKVQYNESAWRTNVPNNTAYAPRYTLVSATGSTTGLGTSQDPFPGKLGITEVSLMSNRNLTDIEEKDSLVYFLFNRAPKTYTLTATLMFSLNDRIQSGEAYYSIQGTCQDTAGHTFPVHIHINTSAYAGNFSTNAFQLDSTYLIINGVKTTPTAIKGNVTINGQNIYRTDLTLTIDAYTSYRIVGDFEVYIPEPVQHTLTIQCSEGGSISLLAPLYSTRTNTSSYTEGTVVQLIPAAEKGWQFAAFSGKDASSIIQNGGVYTLTIGAQDYTLTAVFERQTCIVSSAVSPSNKGSVAIQMNDDLLSDGASVPYQSEVTFTALAIESYRFDGWHDGVSTNPRTLVVTQDTALTALFSYVAPEPVEPTEPTDTTTTEPVDTTEIIQPIVIPKYTIRTFASPSGKGDVHMTYMDTELESGMQADSASVIRMNATAMEGWAFQTWSDGITANPRSLTLTSDTLVQALFVRRRYTLTALSEPADKGTVILTAGGQIVESGLQLEYETSVQLYASAAPHCHFTAWNDGSTLNPRTITLTGHQSYTALFEKDTISYLVMYDNQDSAYYAQLYENEDVVIRMAVLARTIKANTLSTICLPFDVPDLTKTDLCGSVYRFISATGDGFEGIHFSFTFTNEIKAGVPYILLSTDTIVNPFFQNVRLKAPVERTITGEDVTFFASLRPILIPYDPTYFGFAQNMVWAPSTQGMNINAFRCYFKNIAKSAQSAKYIRIFIDGQEYIP